MVGRLPYWLIASSILLKLCIENSVNFVSLVPIEGSSLPKFMERFVPGFSEGLN